MRLALAFIAFATLCSAADLKQVRALIDSGDRAAALRMASDWIATAPKGPERAAALNALAEASATGRAADTARVRELISEARTLDPKQNESLVILATQLSQAGDNKQAVETLERAEAPDFRTELLLARYRMLAGDRDGSRKLFEAALASVEERFGRESEEAAEALNGLGTLLNTISKFPEAVAVIERAVAIDEKSPGRGLADSLANLAYSTYAQGDYRKSRALAERAISILEADPAKSLVSLGWAYRVLGQSREALGDLTGARADLQRSIDADQRLYGSDSMQVADDENVLAIVAANSHDDEGARKGFAAVLAIYEARLGPDNTRTGGALTNLGQMLSRMNRFDEAKNCLERALAIQIRAVGPESSVVGQLYQKLAQVSAGTGQYAEAVELFRKNLEIWRVALGPSHPFTLSTLPLLADALLKAGDRAAALKTALEAARLRREYVTDTMRTLSEKEALQLASRNTSFFETMLALAGDNETSLRAVWDELIRSRALILDEMAARSHAVRVSADPAMPSLLATAATARSELARAALNGKDKGIAEKRAAVQRADEAVAARSDFLQDRMLRGRAGLDEVAAALPPDAALLAYAHFNGRYSAFALHNGRATVVSLGEASRIEARTAALGREIARERDAAGHGERHNEELYRAAGVSLRQVVWDPVIPSLAGAKLIYIVPDGALQLVNFAALPVGADRYLTDSGPVLHILSAERDLVRTHRPVSARNALLAVGNPAFASPAASMRGLSSGCAPKFDSLPASGREAADVAALWRSLGNPAETLTGAAATEPMLEKSAPGKRVLHIATHGFFLENRCGDSAALSENPLLRSGLALSDGVLTAEQAAGLNLEDTDWVVLSGCDTGLGDVRAGEGVLGLRRAFQEAGARTVVASLWPVEDDATRKWMAALYRYRFVKGMEAAEALRTADRDALRTRRAGQLSTHPYYWASFIAVERE
jgi:CHAT domain-containing protein/Tfp pilus assembly protein PilF